MEHANIWGQFLSLFGVVILCAGASGLILMALLIWLEKFWTSRIREREFAEINRALEFQRDEIARFQTDYRHQFEMLSADSSGALRRKRDIYTNLATTMRLLLQSGLTADHQRTCQNDFLTAYDVGYMWAAEPVLAVVREFAETLEKKAAADRNLTDTPRYAPAHAKAAATAKELDASVQEIYQRCLMEMRKDSGFPVRPPTESLPRNSPAQP